jgi:hypothetical protein
MLAERVWSVFSERPARNRVLAGQMVFSAAVRGRQRRDGRSGGCPGCRGELPGDCRPLSGAVMPFPGEFGRGRGARFWHRGHPRGGAFPVRRGPPGFRGEGALARLLFLAPWTFQGRAVYARAGMSAAAPSCPWPLTVNYPAQVFAREGRRAGVSGTACTGLLPPAPALTPGAVGGARSGRGPGGSAPPPPGSWSWSWRRPG